MENKVDLHITEPLAWLLSKPKRIKIAVGGRGSQKSTGVGDIMLMFCDQGERVCCAREFQNSIDDSVHESLKDEIDRLNLEGFDVLSSEIRSAKDGNIFYKGLSRNITSLKSLAGVKRLWIEEGESVSEKSLKVLTPSIRSSAAANEKDGDPPEIWVTMNRGSSTDAVAVKYLKRAEDELKRTGRYEDDLIMVVELNWRQNPWFPPELEQERLDDLENLPRTEYDHIWEGEYNDSIDNSIILPEWFDACVDAHKIDRLKKAFDPTGAVITAHDPSGQGKDSKGYASRHGSIITRVGEKTTGDIDDGFDWAIDSALEAGADWFIYDEDGMGSGAKRQVSAAFSGKRVEYQGFRGSLSGKAQDNAEKPYLKMDDGKDVKPKKHKDEFLNNRAQYYIGRLGRRMKNTYSCVIKGVYMDPDEMISIDSEGCENIKQLRSELCRIPAKPNGRGLKQVLSKDEMKKLGIPSPNMGDSVMMTMFEPPIKKKERKPATIPNLKRL